MKAFKQAIKAPEFTELFTMHMKWSCGSKTILRIKILNKNKKAKKCSYEEEQRGRNP